MSNEPAALFIGRWSPFHNGHDHIIRKALDAGHPVVVAIRDTPLSEHAPYSVAERREMIENTYVDEDVTVILIPDICSVNIGRKVGYEINRYAVPLDIAGISATDIRTAIAAGDDSWKNNVPEAVAKCLDKGGE